MIKKAATIASRGLGKIQRRLDRFSGSPSRKPGKRITLGDAYDTGWADVPCVFALSTGRTGTQTLAALANLSPDVAAYHEPPPRLVQLSYEAYMENPSTDDWEQKWTQIARGCRDDLILQAHSAGKVYLESNNRLTYIAQPLANAFPASKFIFSHREPYAVIRSGMKRGAYQGPGMAWNFARIRPRPHEEYHQTWNDLTPLQKEAWRWAAINQAALDFAASQPPTRILDLPSATFFSDTNEARQRLFQFIDVREPEAVAASRVMSKRMNAQVNFGGLEFEWTPNLYAVVRPFVSDVAQKLGYEIR